MARVSLYPPNPDDVPDDLTVPSPKFRARAFFVLCGLFVFFFLYLGLVIGSAYLVFLAITRPVRQGDFIINVILAVPAGILFLFLFKGFFKRSRRERSFDIEINEQEHPRLFDFIDRLCADIGAPLPRRVYVNFEVNASAGYDTTILSLFWSRAKNLRIGLGLVNTLNLTEFKALLAHEFGHFSQNSMKIGGYVYMTCRIVDDLVYGRDFFDDFLERWRGLDIRIAWPAWAISGVIWGLRQVLGLLFKVIFLSQKALSRQMEFNADLVAVSVTGSDAPVHLLARSCFSDACLGQALAELSSAADHHLYTRDIFHHQTRAAAYIRKVSKRPNLGEPPPLPRDADQITQVFHPDDEEDVPVMWLDHPTNYDREQNAKEEYIRTQFDERSPWLLFDKPEEVRERVTYRYYRIRHKVPKDVILAEPEEVQAFIDEEHAETTYDPRYHGLYDNRSIDPGDLTELARLAQARPWELDQIASTHANLYNVEVKHRMQRYNQRLEEFDLLQAIHEERYRPKDDEFEFRGEFYDRRDARKLMKKVDRELEQDNDWLAGVDRQVFLVHYQMAMRTDPGALPELVSRYRFHLGVQQIWRDLRAQGGPVGAALSFLESQNKSRVDPGAFQEMLAIFKKAQRTLADCLDTADRLTLPPLKNMIAGEALGPFLLKDRLVRRLSSRDQQISGAWITKLLNQVTEVQKKVNRIHFKSLGGLLVVQERISAKCLGQIAALPTAAAVKPPPLPG